MLRKILDTKGMHFWSAAVGVCTIYTLIVLTLCYLLPFSMLFSAAHSYEDLFQKVDSATDLRTRNAKQYFENVNRRQSIELYNGRLRQKNPSFVLGVITVQRLKKNQSNNSYGYLLQSASLLDSILKQYAFFNNSVPFICNVEAWPQKHQDAVTMYQYMPYTERYGINSLGVSPVFIPGTNSSFAEMTIHMSKYHKETFDYAFCLLSAAALNPEYIILIEDDSLVHKDLAPVLENLIQTRLKFTHEHVASNTKFAYLKLFFPSKWQGFGFEINKLLDLLSWSVVGGSLFHLIWLCLNAQHRHLSFSSSKVFLLGCLVTMISCWLIGRQNVNELRRISKYLYRLQSSEGCCTQAMLYPLEVVSGLSSYLVSSSSNKHTDLAILDFSHVSNLPTYQVEPSLFFHLGMHTTLNLPQKHPEEFVLHI